MKLYATVVIISARWQWTFISLRHEWLDEFIGRELGKATTALLHIFAETTEKKANLGCEVDYNMQEKEEL